MNFFCQGFNFVPGFLLHNMVLWILCVNQQYRIAIVTNLTFGPTDHRDIMKLTIGWWVLIYKDFSLTVTQILWQAHIGAIFQLYPMSTVSRKHCFVRYFKGWCSPDMCNVIEGANDIDFLEVLTLILVNDCMQLLTLTLRSELLTL